MLFLAVDFGTHSTLAAFVVDGVLKFVDFEEEKYSAPTVLYFPKKQRVNERKYGIGYQALGEYFEEGGRLIFAIKSLLGNTDFSNTLVTGFGNQDAAELCGLYLARVKGLAETQFGQNFDGVVLGKPANFSDVASKQLRRAAHFAGFKKVVFVPEPIAAGINYLESTQRDTKNETCFILDAGGGTTDFAVVRQEDHQREVLATGGLPLAGNAFSAAISYNHLANSLGKNATWGEKKFPIPSHYYEALKDWRRLQDLRSERMGEILVNCSDQVSFGRFVKLVSDNLGWELYQAVDQAKLELSSQESSVVQVSRLNLQVPISLKEFERYTWPTLREIEREALRTLARSDTGDSVSTVILTGGSSKVPAVVEIAKKIFPHSRHIMADPFNSVVGGLSIVAERLNKRQQR